MSRPTGNRKKTRLSIVERFSLEIRAIDGRAETTAASYGDEIHRFANWLAKQYPASSLETATARMIRQHVVCMYERGLSASRRRVAVFGLRAFYQWLIATGVRDDDPTDNISVPKQQAAEIEPYTDADVSRILAYCQQAVRDAASHKQWLRATVELVALLLLRYAGLRVSELAALKVVDFDREKGQLKVNGKGSKKRTVPLPDSVVVALCHYLDHVRPQLPGEVHLLSNPSAFAGSKTYGSFNPRAVRDVTTKYGKQAEVAGRHNPHRWRHTTATSMVRHGTDLETLRQFLGHSTLEQVLVYVHLTDEDRANRVRAVWDTVDGPDIDHGLAAPLLLAA